MGGQVGALRRWGIQGRTPWDQREEGRVGCLQIFAGRVGEGLGAWPHHGLGGLKEGREECEGGGKREGRRSLEKPAKGGGRQQARTPTQDPGAALRAGW